MMMNILKIIKNIKATSLIFTLFIIATTCMLLWYTHSTSKTRQLQAEVAKATVENQQLRTQNEELLNQFNTHIKRQQELSNELLQLSEEKTNCYKKIIKYNEKLKKTAIKAPVRVERLVNRNFNRVYKDVAGATRADK
jgi:hypothetical protein